MSTLVERIREVSALSAREAEHLRSLCSSWQVLADLSFSDLLLYVPARHEEVFEICAQLRPFTSQTLYPQDMVRTRVTQPDQPIVERAFREGQIWAQDEPVLVDGIPLRMDAVPVRFNGQVIAVMTKEGSPATSRRPGRLEEVYLEAAEKVSAMIAAGDFPFRQTPPGEWPRVSDGLLVLDESGSITWASPNALSSLRRLGVKDNVLGRSLDALGLGTSPTRRGLRTKRLLDGEFTRGENHVTLRVMPLLSEGRAVGALVLSRDVSEVRQKERMISVKDATIREIHHRVKNNLQTIASLLRLQVRRLHSDEAKAALQESVLRIGSIALVHETLAEQTSDVGEFGEVARRIGAMVSEGLVLPERGIEVKVTGSTGPLSADLATPLAVTLAELLQNAIEHAFPNDLPGTVGIEVAEEGDRVTVVVWDDGVGLGDGPLEGERLGLQIVRSLIEEMGGSVTITSEAGTRVDVRVPLKR
jgi:two-component system, sensor histidine kinase PdtaS